MHSRSLLPLLAVAVIAALLAAGCTVPPPDPAPPGPTAGETPSTVVTTPATSAGTTAPPISRTAPTPASLGATPSARSTGDSGDVPSTGVPTAAATSAASPAVTATGTSAPTVTGTATTTVTPTACATIPAGVTWTATPGATAVTPPAGSYTEPELRYLLLDRYGEDRFFWCDPDEYPVSRGDELARALEAFPAIENDTAEFTAIAARTGIGPPFSDEEKLTVYREHKKLRAIPLDPRTTGAYAYSITLGTEQEGRRASGTVRTDGAIVEERSDPAVLTCPICLVAGMRIATPVGPVPVEDVRAGMSVWTIGPTGERCSVPVLRTASMEAPAGHEAVEVRLSDRRRVTASPGHPTAEGAPLGGVGPGDRLDGAIVSSVEVVPYGGMTTYDLLPAGPGGQYWAEGVLLGSTLR